MIFHYLKQINELYCRYYCNCSDGYTGLHCEMDIDECVSDPCQNDAECTDRPGTYQCVCQPGWAGKNNTINKTETLLYLFFNTGVKSPFYLLADPRKIKGQNSNALFLCSVPQRKKGRSLKEIAFAFAIVYFDVLRCSM